MTAARNFVLFNPDSHLTGYHRNLVKSGMDPLEATKRVARALVRVIYRKLASLPEANKGGVADNEENLQLGESDMANGSIRGGQGHTSNMSLSSPQNAGARRTAKVKRGFRITRKTEKSGKTRKTRKKFRCVKKSLPGKHLPLATWRKTTWRMPFRTFRATAGGLPPGPFFAFGFGMKSFTTSQNSSRMSLQLGRRGKGADDSPSFAQWFPSHEGDVSEKSPKVLDISLGTHSYYHVVFVVRVHLLNWHQEVFP